jgi:parallel beta-helix repeat protein
MYNGGIYRTTTGHVNGFVFEGCDAGQNSPSQANISAVINSGVIRENILEGQQDPVNVGGSGVTVENNYFESVTGSYCIRFGSLKDSRLGMNYFTSGMSVTRNVEVVNGESIRVNVQAFGARGDDTTNDTKAIQNAIDAANGGEVFIPAGNYKIESVTPQSDEQDYFLQIDADGTTLRGEGKATRLYTTTDATDTDFIQIINCSDAEVRNLQVEGPGTSTSTGGVHVQPSAERVVVDSVYATKWGSTLGAIAVSTSNEGWVQNCTTVDNDVHINQSSTEGTLYAINNRIYNFSNGSTNQGYRINGKNGYIIGGYIEGQTNKTAIHIYGQSSEGSGEGYNIMGVVSNATGASVKVVNNSGRTDVARDINIVGCHFNNGFGVHFKGATNCFLSNTTITDSKWGVRIKDNAGVLADNNHVTNCTFRLGGDKPANAAVEMEGAGTVRINNTNIYPEKGDTTANPGDGMIIMDNEVPVTKDAEKPNSTGKGPNFINFTDSGDGTGDGIYYEDSEGNTHGPL